MAEEKSEQKKKNERKDNALRRFVLRMTGADKVIGGLQGKTPEEVEAERKQQDEERRKARKR